MKNIFLIIILSTTILSITKGQDTEAKKAFNKTLKTYFDTKNALATDNVNLAGTGAKNLLASLNAFPVKTLTAQQQTEWKKQVDEIKKFAAPMVLEREIKTQRKSFEDVSYAMIKLVKVANLSSNDIYVQYCPMVKKSWLNEVEDIQNPFYGSKMYDCGEVTETIAKK